MLWRRRGLPGRPGVPSRDPWENGALPTAAGLRHAVHRFLNPAQAIHSVSLERGDEVDGAVGT